MAEGGGDEEWWLLKRPIEIRQSPSPDPEQVPSSKVKRSSKSSKYSPAEERRLGTNFKLFGTISY